MNYVVLEAPDFSLQAWLRLQPDLSGKPAAVVQGEGRKAVVIQLNDHARHAGIWLGMGRAQALGICSGLIARTSQPKAEADASALLLSEAWTLSPYVEPTAPGICTVDASARPPEAVQRELRAVLSRLNAQGLHVRAGVAPSPLVARFAAHRAEPIHRVDDSREFLTPLPVALLDLTPAEADLFEGLGLRTLGELVRLPQSSLTARLGQRGAELWSQACGCDWRPLRLAVSPQRFVASYDLEDAIETLEPLLFLLRRFTDSLASQLAHALLVADSLRLALRTEGDETVARDFRLPEPTAKPEVLFAVLENYLADLRTKHAVNGLELELFPVRATVRQDGLFDNALRDPHGFYSTLARAGAVLGEARVGTVRLEDTHRPDSFSLTVPPAVIPDYVPLPAPPARGPAFRRFRPQPLARVTTHGQVPVKIEGERISGVVREAAGPWRRSGNWWDADAWTREEWDVELTTGGVFRLVRTPQGWCVEGTYD